MSGGEKRMTSADQAEREMTTGNGACYYSIKDDNSSGGKEKCHDGIHGRLVGVKLSLTETHVVVTKILQPLGKRQIRE